MASLKDFGIPDVGTGILHPTMTHHWRAVIGNQLISVQATSCVINMKKSTITLEVQQPAPHAQEMLKAIGSLGRYEHEIFIELLDGNHSVLGTIGGFAEMEDHEFRLDYSMNAIATHKLVFKFKPSA